MYLNFNDVSDILTENKKMEQYVKDIVYQQTIKTTKNSVGPDGKPTDEEVLAATKLLCTTLVKLFVGAILIQFADAKLSKFALNTIRKNEKNTKLFEFINKEIEEVYKKHKDYRPCSGKEFMKTNVFDYMVAEWRDKTAKEKAKLAGYKTIDGTIIALASRVPVPGSALLAIPIKMMLVYVGCDIGLGAIYNLAVDIDGHVLSIGINYKPVGFTLSNIILYSFNKKNKLVGTYLKNPPENLYQITEEDAKKILDKYGKDSGLDVLKKWVKYNNEDK